MYEHGCLEKIKKLYKNAGKCDCKHQYKEMIKSSLVSTPEGCTDNILMTPKPYMYTKNTSARKPLRQFTETLDVKHKTYVLRFGASKAKRKATKKIICCGQTFKNAVVIQK